MAALQRGAEHDAGERDDRADRQIDAARDDHERHPNRDDRVDARLLDDIEQIRNGEEVRRQDPQPRRQQDEANDSAELASRPQSSPRAALSTRSSVASSRASSAWMRPWCITRMRSLMPSSSGSSDEIMMIAAPRAVMRFIR